eukprot:scaffold23369_cov67-Phaeocystis_antarctica.AAC.5
MNAWMPAMNPVSDGSELGLSTALSSPPLSTASSPSSSLFSSSVAHSCLVVSASCISSEAINVWMPAMSDASGAEASAAHITGRHSLASEGVRTASLCDRLDSTSASELVTATLTRAIALATSV